MGYIVLSLFVFILDIMTKLVAELDLQKRGSIPIWQDVFHLTYVENSGIAFGIFQDARWFNVGSSIVVLILLSILFTKTTFRTGWMRNGIALIYGGAMGNLMERLAKGYVVDFFDFRLIHFPVFNIADIAVCVGVVMLMIHFLVADKAEAKAKAMSTKKIPLAETMPSGEDEPVE